MSDLKAFDLKSNYHHSYFLISYNDMFWKDSEIYLVPVNQLNNIIVNHTNVSLNILTVGDSSE